MDHGTGQGGSPTGTLAKKIETRTSTSIPSTVASLRLLHLPVTATCGKRGAKHVTWFAQPKLVVLSTVRIFIKPAVY